jgi:hypothetical protein
MTEYRFLFDDEPEDEDGFDWLCKLVGMDKDTAIASIVDAAMTASKGIDE